jgi:hypothetical protein
MKMAETCTTTEEQVGCMGAFQMTVMAKGVIAMIFNGGGKLGRRHIKELLDVRVVMVGIIIPSSGRCRETLILGQLASRQIF